MASDTCREIAATKTAMRKLLDLARQINPDLPPDKELEGKVVSITMSKDWIGASVLH
jgi:hypothetical protein